MQNKKIKIECDKIKKLLEGNNLKEAQIKIEELNKKIALIERLNSCWGTWRTNFQSKEKLELEMELKILEGTLLVLNENFDKNIETLREYSEVE